MAILKQGQTTLNAGSKGDKGDAGVSGGSNPNINPVTNLAEFQSALIDVNNLIEIREDIQLTGNLTIPNGKELIFSTVK